MSIFPAGLEQPPGSARFGQDALLLAAFAAVIANKSGTADILAIETGCACGAALLGFAMLVPSSRCLGIEREETLAAAARRNSQVLNLGDRCRFIVADLAALPGSISQTRQKADVVMANPPWRNVEHGLVSPADLRKKAYWAQKDTLSVFLKGASLLLRRHGYFCLILPDFLLPQFFCLLRNMDIGLRKIQPVCSFVNEAAKRFLLLCRKNAASDFEFAYPLTLHERKNDVVGYTDQALAFCPWLGRSVNADAG